MKSNSLLFRSISGARPFFANMPNISLAPIIIFLILCLSIPVLAKEANTVSPAESYSISGYPLTLDEAIRYTLQNNFTIEIARLERKIISYEVPAAKAVYDTYLRADIGYTVDQGEIPSSRAPQKSNTTVWNAGLEKKLPSGTVIGLDLLNSRQSGNPTAISNSPYYTSDLQLGLAQPILKNGFGFLDRSAITLVKLDVSRLDLSLLDAIEKDIADVMRGYWSLYFSYGNLSAKEEALAYAEDFLRITDEQYTNGALEETDLFAAKSNVERRKKEVREAETAISNASDELKLAMNFFPEFDLFPSESPPISFESFGNGENVLLALEQRRDLQAATLQIESQKLDVKMKKNSLLPQIDLIATFTSNGLSRDMINAFGEAAGMEDNTYFLGAQFSLPLENSAARSRFSQSELEKAKALWDMHRIEKIISTAIDKDIRTLALTQDQLTHNKKIIEYEKKKLEGEEKKYQFGRSSSDIILRYEDDVINAQIAHLSSERDFALALINLKRNQNVLLDEIDWTTYENIKDISK